MTENEKTYMTFRWLADIQLLEPALIDEMNEIEQLSRAVSEVLLEPAELYTTSS